MVRVRPQALTPRAPLAFAVFASLALVSLSLALGCATTSNAATENHVFYQYDDQPSAKGQSSFEQPYPPLDRKAEGKAPEYTGVSILGGTVHLSRPANWTIRRASLTAKRRYIEYVSPNEYLFAVYERLDSPGDSWSDILGRYAEDVKAKGGEVLGARIPMATWNAQGRQYIVRRTVKGQRSPFSNASDEFLLRGKKEVDLVEIVHQGESIAPVVDELLRVMDTLQLR